MRDLSKTKLEARWSTEDGTPLMQIRRGKRGAGYICFMIEVPGQGSAPGQLPIQKTYVPRDFRDLTANNLKLCAQQIAEYLEAGRVKQEVAEKSLDLIYAELNRRLNGVAP